MVIRQGGELVRARRKTPRLHPDGLGLTRGDPVGLTHGLGLTRGDPVGFRVNPNPNPEPNP